jgi:hypothetical protein
MVGDDDMTRNSTLRTTVLTSASLVLLNACTGQPQGLKIRAIGESAANVSPDAAGLAEAHAMLRLGNSGLALEAFRKIQRANPSAAALEGIAQCYAAMGRDDLAKSNYEAALAMKPQDGALLTAVAVVMDRLGDTDEAAIAREQATDPLLTAEAAAKELTTDVATTSLTTAARGLSTQDSRDLSEVFRARDLDPALSSVTVKLPPVRMAERNSPRAIASGDMPPRLERISPSVVALVTTAKSLWTPRVVAKTASSVTVRWEPIRSASREINVRILNAAAIDGVAVAARQMLMKRGWRRIDVAAHGAVEQSSVVFYPADRRRLARSLAAQFGIPARQSDTPVMIVVLGTDLAGRFAG